MAILVSDGENSPLCRFLRQNLPGWIFEADTPLFCFPGDAPLSLTPPKECILIADASFSLPAVTENIRVLTCGRSLKDTFTFSARSEDSASVALMRAVSTPEGVIEPMEVPVDFPKDTGDLAVLGTVAVRILTGTLPDGRLRLYPPAPKRPHGKNGFKSE